MSVNANGYFFEDAQNPPVFLLGSYVVRVIAHPNGKYELLTTGGSPVCKEYNTMEEAHAAFVEYVQDALQGEQAFSQRWSAMEWDTSRGAVA